MRLTDLKENDEQLDEFLPAIGAAVGGIARGAAAVGGAALKGAQAVGGAVAKGIAAQIEQTEALLAKSNSAAAKSMLKNLRAAREAYLSVVDYVVNNTKSDIKNVFAGSVNYLRLSGLTLAGWQLARALLAAEARQAEDPSFFDAKIKTARFFAEHLLSLVPGIASSVVEGGEAVNALSVEQF